MTDFERVYRQYYHDVYKYVFSLCKNESLAEEITQEAFYKAMENMDKFDGRCRLYVWLCQIAKNTYFTYLKKQKKLVPEAEFYIADDNSKSPEEALLDKDTAARLHVLLHRMDEPYKEVFSLRIFGELSFAQIGELFGKTDSWARLVFYRAKKEIRRGLDENDV